MRILYIAKHGQYNSADDEGAIAHALTQLGHKVICAQEEEGRDAVRRTQGVDLLLFHKWLDLKGLKYATCKKVFWYFDLVRWPDPTLKSRCLTRLSWINAVVPLVDLGFCTDGDFVAYDHTGKLVWLPQGADERVVGPGTRRGASGPLLFTGLVKNVGMERASWWEEVKERYGGAISHYSSGVYGRGLADLIAQHLIVVAPDSPVTDRYWSNRVYTMLGYGAFLIHPYCRELAEQYVDGQEIVFYRNRMELYSLIEHYLPLIEERHTIAQAGFERTLREHTYRARCERMIQVVQQRLRVG